MPAWCCFLKRGRRCAVLDVRGQWLPLQQPRKAMQWPMTARLLPLQSLMCRQQGQQATHHPCGAWRSSRREHLLLLLLLLARAVMLPWARVIEEVLRPQCWTCQMTPRAALLTSTAALCPPLMQMLLLVVVLLSMRRCSHHHNSSAAAWRRQTSCGLQATKPIRNVRALWADRH